MRVLALLNIKKSFGGIQALKGVDLELRGGEIHALVGENGAGKSTLIKIAGGVFPPDEGSIFLDGFPVRFSDPRDAQKNGIAVIHQTPVLCQHLSVAENILLGHLPARFGIIRWRKAKEVASQLLSQLGVSLPLSEPVKKLSAAQQQIVALARALSLQAKWLILDEPTASLSLRETERLFAILRQLKAQGVGILFVSHRLEEVLEISDRITVLRDGEKVATVKMEEATRELLIEMMAGKKVSELASASQFKPKSLHLPLLQLSHVSVDGEIKNVNLTIMQGEVVGLFGLVGAGRSELAQGIVGLRKISEGQVIWKGKRVRFPSPKEALREGVAYLPEDRLHQSLLQIRSIRENIGLPNFSKFSILGIVNEKAESDAAKIQAQALKVRMATIEQPVRELSGGNQQKVAIAKWLLTEPKLFILDEPTHGIDVATKAEIHRLILDWKQQGKAVLLISSELEELQRLCDRIVVMRQGQVVGEFEPNAPKAQILEAAFRQVERIGQSESEETHSLWKSLLWRFFSREVSLLLFIALIAFVVGMKNPAFLSLEHWLTLVQESAPTIIGAIAISMVILSGNLDLSVGSVLGACAMAAGHSAKADLPLLLVILLALGLGASIGAFNGSLVTRLAIPSIIVTLGMMGIVRGTMIVLTKGYWVIGLPESFRWLGTGKLLGVPVPVWLSLALLICSWFLLRQTSWGRDIYAIGNNMEAARLAGIPVRRRIFSIFVACGALIGLAAVVYAARFPVVQSETGKGFELDVITAAVFGGVNIFGGSGSVIGAALGAFSVTVLHSALTFMQLAGEWDKFALGGLILMSIIADSVRHRR